MGDTNGNMTTHQTRPQIAARLKRIHGHLAKVITMTEDQAPCGDIVQLLFAGNYSGSQPWLFSGV